VFGFELNDASDDSIEFADLTLVVQPQLLDFEIDFFYFFQDYCFLFSQVFGLFVA
jgi:hypothetical protein